MFESVRFNESEADGILGGLQLRRHKRFPKEWSTAGRMGQFKLDKWKIRCILNIVNSENSRRIDEVLLGVGRKICRLIGWKEAIGQVYVLLYIRKQRLSLDDIAELSNLSRSHVWGIIQQLLRIGAVNKVWSTEGRKDYFVAERDFQVILMGGVLPLLRTKLGLLGSYLDNAKRELLELKQRKHTKSPAEMKDYEAMLDRILEHRDKMENLLDVIGRAR